MTFLQLVTCLSHYPCSVVRNISLGQLKLCEHRVFKARLQKIPSKSVLAQYQNCKATPEGLTLVL